MQPNACNAQPVWAELLNCLHSQAREPLGQLLQCIAILAALPVGLPTPLTHPELLVQMFDVLWHITDR